METLAFDSNVLGLASVYQDALRPPPKMTIDQWADKNRVLPRESSGEPGKWRTDRTPYLREIMRELSPSSHTEEVVFMKGSQIGGTEVGINWILSIIAMNPAPSLYVQPTVDLAEKHSRQRITPSINECEALQNLVMDNRSRDTANTILQKDFLGGTLMITGANSAVGLRSMPMQNLFADEVDGWPADADGEGDPLELARRRTTNFSRRKCFIVSTPTLAGMSRIEGWFAKSDQRYYYVPCPHCGFFQTITWDKLKFDDHNAATVRMYCQGEGCGTEIPEHYKTWMLERGEWRKSNPESTIAGFHLSALYSPLGWYSWKEAVQDNLDALGDPMKRKVWVNTVLGELWDDAATTIDSHWLMKRKENYQEKYHAEVPGGVLLLTAGVDTQDNRLECSVYGWGVEYEHWVIAHETFMGDPGRSDVWGLLDMFLLKDFVHEKGMPLRIAATCVDAMGHHTDMVYKFCKERFLRRVFATQGRGGAGRPLIIGWNNKNKAGVYLFRIGVDQGKETVYSRLKIKDPGAGYCHFPDTLEDKFFQQLTSEKRVMRNNQGIPKLEWVLSKNKRNEALDCAVGALAALSILNPNLALLGNRNIVYQARGNQAQNKNGGRRIISKGVQL